MSTYRELMSSVYKPMKLSGSDVSCLARGWVCPWILTKVESRKEKVVVSNTFDNLNLFLLFSEHGI